MSETQTPSTKAAKVIGSIPIKDRVLGWTMMTAVALVCVISQTPFAYEAVKASSNGDNLTKFVYVVTVLAFISSAMRLAHWAMAYANELFEKHTITKK